MTTLTRSTRPQFVAEFPAFAGMSTREIREALRGNLHLHALVHPAGWRLPTGEAKAKRAEAIAAHAARKQEAAVWAELSAL